MNKKKIIEVAKIVNVHGIRGQVKIITFSDDPMNFFKYKEVKDKNGDVYQLKPVHIKPKFVIASIYGITNRNQAESLIGKSLFIDYDNLRKLESENEFYYNDLIGLDVLDESNNCFAKIKYVFNFGASDLLEIEFEDKTTQMIPFSKEVVIKVDVQAGFAIVRMPDMV